MHPYIIAEEHCGRLCLKHSLAHIFTRGKTVEPIQFSESVSQYAGWRTLKLPGSELMLIFFFWALKLLQHDTTTVMSAVVMSVLRSEERQYKNSNFPPLGSAHCLVIRWGICQVILHLRLFSIYYFITVWKNWLTGIKRQIMCWISEIRHFGNTVSIKVNNLFLNWINLTFLVYSTYIN